MRAKREPAFVRLTLEWCNRQRAKKGKKPLARLPRGIQSNAHSCPCGSATGLAVFAGGAHPVGRHGYVDHSVKILVPKSVEEFVIAFDAGALPQYVKKTKP